jgi:ribosomal protein S12 methylthiotransferase accessory factor
VWAAVTPLAADLSVHAGAARDPAAARRSAIMEAVERVSAEEVARHRIRVAAFDQLGEDAIDPAGCDLPFETAYRPDRPIAWVEGRDLATGAPVWVALDLVLSPAREGVCVGVETNGLAAGSTVAQATLHALLELIERDAHSHEEFARRHWSEPPPIRIVPVASLTGEAAACAGALSAAGMTVLVRDLTHDLGVAVYRATILDGGFPGREGRATAFSGTAADIDPASAVLRALCEAVQSRAAFLLGARDSFERGRPARRGDPVPLRGTRRVGLPAPAEIADPFGHLLDRLRAVGLTRCAVVDLTRFEVPVVRVIVPGLAAPYGDSRRRPSSRLLRTLA